MTDIPETPGRFERWRGRQRVTPEDRRRVLQAVTIRSEEGWWVRFGIMFALSVVIATTGLSQGSTAVVIGAMLVAPLMAPILGFAAGLAMGSFGRAGRSLAVIAVSAAGGVALAWALSGLFSGDSITGEVLARTSPDIRDLIVALAAGTAGAYATIRSDISGSLPGAGVAVALVPPLATVGITLRAGRSDLSIGALLLFATNVTAIVSASVVVFLITGFVPPALLARRRQHVGVGAALAVAVSALVTIPLLLATNQLASTTRTGTKVKTAVLAWLDATDLELVGTSIRPSTVTIDLVGADTPPATDGLQVQLTDILGRPITVNSRWTQRTTAANHSEPSITLDTGMIRPSIENWLAGGGIDDAQITSLALDARSLSLELTSTVAPPPATLLGSAITEQFGVDIAVDIRWTERAAGPVEDARRNEIRTIAAQWARSTAGLEVSTVTVDDAAESVTVNFVGPLQPSDVSGLRARLRRQYPGLRPVIRFVQRTELLDPTTTTTTIPTTVPGPGGVSGPFQ